MSMPTQWERMGTPTQCDMMCDTFVVSIMRKVKLGRLAGETLGLHAENDPRDFAKPVKAISFPQDVLSTSDRRLIELKNQVQRLMEAHIAPMQPIQVNKITSLCEIYSAPHDTQYYMEDPEQAFVKYASSRTDKAGDNKLEGEVREEEDNPKNIKPNPSLPPDPSVSLVTKKFHQLNSLHRIACLVPHSSDDGICFPRKGDDNDVMFIEIIKKNDDSYEEEPNTDESARTEELRVEYFNIFLTRSELAYRNFTYVIDFMIVKDISSIIDPRLSQVLLGKPFAKISNMTHDPPEGVVGFTNMADEVAYKMPHKIEQYNSLSELEKEHTKSVYLRNEEDKRRGVEYEKSPKSVKFFKENEKKIFSEAGDGVRIYPDGVVIFDEKKLGSS
ncbi:hypothetical protein Tco_0926924 [Tanacetum coccineum]|uniref:Uncharacterized protein n=1 Tax=Tanacetum coccineum TaxID=301880 RepID=A0ABQ5DC59_9ASTR